MNRITIPAIFAATMLSGCAGDIVVPQQSGSFSVTSQPDGAIVYVMGKELGKTPLEVKESQVFPVSYPKELESHYGRIALNYPGCEPFEKAVSGTILANGLKAKLDCVASSPAPASPVTPLERLRQLEALLKEGLISEEEYQTKRQGILQEL